MSRILHAAGLFTLILLLAACAGPTTSASTRVTLLPQADGTPSAVTVRPANSAGNTSDTREWRLDQPWQTALLTTDRPPSLRTDEAAPVRRRYEPLFSSAPPAPARFVLFFRTGTTQLTAESQQAIGRVLAETMSRSGAEIVLIGHTDTTSDGESNDVLSMRRALLVREQFVQRGFPAALIEATGRGERDPAVRTRNNVDEARNRRVEILVR